MLPVAVHGLSGKLLLHSTSSTSPSGHIGIEVGCSKLWYVFAINLMLVITAVLPAISLSCRSRLERANDQTGQMFISEHLTQCIPFTQGVRRTCLKDDAGFMDRHALPLALISRGQSGSNVDDTVALTEGEHRHTYVQAGVGAGGSPWSGSSGDG